MAVPSDQRAQQRNNAFDYLRVIAFCGVVVLHVVTPNGPFSIALNVLARFSVPFFFSLAGYFSWGIEAAKIRARIISTGKLCLAGVVLYGVTSAIGLTPSINDFLVIDGVPATVRNFLVWNYYPTAYPLWYLFALLYVYIFAYGVVRFHIAPKHLIAYGAGLLVARFALSELTPTVEPLGFEMRSWLFFGIPFFCLGMYLRCNVSKLRHVAFVYGFALIALGIILSFLECVLFGLQEVYLGSVILVVGCYVMCVRHPLTSLNFAKVTVLLSGGKACLIAYMVHYALIAIASKAFAVYSVPESLFRELVTMMVIIVLSLGIGVVFSRTSVTASLVSRLRRAR